MTILSSPDAPYSKGEFVPSMASAALSAQGVAEFLPPWAGGDTAAGTSIFDVPTTAPSETLPTETPDYKLQKRALDLTIAIAILPAVAVVLLLIGLAVLFTSGFPIFYRQSRLGRHGSAFRIIKFRTMRNNADQALGEILLHHPEIREEWLRTHKLKGDPRITRLGRLLRSTSLDEVPQIINVLRGEMSFVGPRPIVRAEVERYGDRFRFYSSTVPGITGLWQVSGRSNLSYEERVRIDEKYARQWSLWSDVRILWKTPRVVLGRDGSC